MKSINLFHSEVMNILDNFGSFKTIELFNCELFIDKASLVKLLVFTNNALIEIDISKKDSPEIKTFILYDHISNYFMDRINNTLVIELNNDMFEVTFNIIKLTQYIEFFS